MARTGSERSLLLELAILGLLKEQDLHGYELRKRLTDVLGFGRAVSFGSLYPALSRLEAAGAVKAVEAAPGPPGRAIPLTGSLGGELAAFRARASLAGGWGANRGRRGKKVYGITEAGERRFEALLATEPGTGDDDHLFSLRLTFARYLPDDVRLRLLERRRSQLVERLSRLGQHLHTSRDRVDAYARSLLEHDRDATAQDISWLERLIAAERGSLSTEAGASRSPDVGAPGPDTSPTEVPPS